MTGLPTSKASSLYKRIRIQLVLGISGLILLLSGLLSLYFYQQSKQMLTRLDASMLERVGSGVRTLDDLSRNTLQSLYVNLDVVAFASSDTENILDITRLVNRLRDYSLINPFFRSIYVYNGRQDLMVNIPQGSFTESETFFDRAPVDMLQAYPQKPIPRLRAMTRRIQANTSGQPDPHDVLTYCLYTPTVDGNGIDSAIFLNVDAGALEALVSAYDAPDGIPEAEVLAIDAGGYVLSQAETDRFGQNLSDVSWYREILAVGEDEGSLVTRVDGRKTFLTWVTVSSQKWRLVSLTPARMVFFAVGRLMGIVLATSGLILLVGILYAAYASRRIYRPIGNLVRLVKEGGSEAAAEGGDEVDGLARAFRKLSQRSMTATRRERIQDSERRIRAHLDASAPLASESLTEVLETLATEMRADHPVLPVVLRVNGYAQFQEENRGAGRDTLFFGACNVLMETIEPVYAGIALDMGNDQAVLLLQQREGSDAPKDGWEAVPLLLSGVMPVLGQHLGFTFSIAMGCEAGWNELPESYRDALLLSQYRILFGPECVLTPNMLAGAEDRPFRMPHEEERLLLEAIRSLDAGKADRCLEGWLDGVGSMPAEMITTAAIHLAGAMSGLFGETAGHLAGRSTVLVRTLLEQVGRAETLGALNEAFEAMIPEAISLLEAARTGRPDRTVRKVDALIEQEFKDRNLCLNGIADRIGLSPLYLGRLYKSTMGRSVAESIMKRRMEQVKHLLDTTSLPVQDILEQSGLEKSNYFYTVFRKHFGISLGDYRRKISD